VSKSKRQHNFDVPEERQHDPITVPENPVTGHPIGTDTEVVNPVDLLHAEVVRAGGVPDDAAFAEAKALMETPTMVKKLKAPEPYPTAQTEIKTMTQQRTEERVYRCVYDDAATARKVDLGARDPDVFCQVCGNRMVRER
jgi:hypothetical protein